MASGRQRPILTPNGFSFSLFSLVQPCTDVQPAEVAKASKSRALQEAWRKVHEVKLSCRHLLLTTGHSQDGNINDISPASYHSIIIPEA